MHPRIDYRKFAPEALKALLAMEDYLSKCGLEHSLLHMLKLRASQINGCAFCIDMHWKDARAAGESEQRLYGLNAISTINAWNRIAISLRAVPGRYQPPPKSSAAH